MTPESGFHCVIESPDSVSRVAPPTSTIRKISAATPYAQIRTGATLRAEVTCKPIAIFPNAGGPSSKSGRGIANPAETPLWS